MARVLAWIVAVERHRSRGGASSPLDFKVPIAQHAIAWADWLLTKHPETQVLLNVNSAPGSAEHARVEALCSQLLNPTDAHSADARALHNTVDIIIREPTAGNDTLLLLWIGHGVMHDSQRYLLHEDAQDPANLRSWEVNSLLQRLRSKGAPPLQLGVFDSCAEYLSQRPGSETLTAPPAAAQPSQYFYFAATAGTKASASLFKPTLAGLALTSLQEISWPPQAQDLHDQLQPRMSQLASRAFRLERTTGSGELWSGNDLVDDGASAIQLRQHARASGQTVLTFQHLWNELERTGVSQMDLAQALRTRPAAGSTRQPRGLAKLRQRLKSEQPDSPTDRLLGDAWVRTRRMESWREPLADLGLTLPQWMAIAERVARVDARRAPEFSELGELLLWTLNMVGLERADEALVWLMLLAARAAHEAGGASAKAARALEFALEQDAELALRLPRVRHRMPPNSTVVLYIELDPPCPPAPGRISKCWLLRDNEVEDFEPPESSDELGDQLNALIKAAGGEGAGRVELLAPYLILTQHPDWLRCRNQNANVFGDATTMDSMVDRVGLETVWPIVLRWKERLNGRITAGHVDVWRQRAAQVQAQMQPDGALVCRFDADGLGGVVRCLAYLPASLREEFRCALIAGDPYMLWPGGEPKDPGSFEAAVRDWLARHRLHELPQALRRARVLDRLPPLVLFIDEPDSNPYDRLPKLQSLRRAAG